MLEKPDIKQIVYIVIRHVKFFKVYERLYALDFFKLAPCQVKNSHKTEGCANITETLYYRIAHSEVL